MQESKRISIKGKEYEVGFPNVGQYYRIEALKQSLSRGLYNSMLGSNTKSASYALDMIDIEATLTVLCPELIKDLKVENFGDLGIKDFKEIKSIYLKEVNPFIREVLELLGSE